MNDLRRRWLDLEMPQAELAQRCGVSVSTLKRVLGGEATASFSTVSAIARALGVQVGLDESENVAEMRYQQARDKARTIVAMVQGTSALEGQALDQSDIELMEQRTIAELLSGPAGRLWGR
ncbi:MAG: helix-turn-helix transcriptional regulator [Phycisphaerae bacterium]|nr:helix-turn-helix transcriptional regulator [Phycisphaerae bacterium]